MATIKQRGDSYKITVSCGYDLNGKQIRRHLTWTPEPGMTKRQLQKAGGMEAEQAARTVGMCQECKRELDALRAASAVKTGNAHGMAANETLASGEPQGPGMEYLGGHGVNPEYIDRELNPDAPEIPAGPAPVEGIIMDFDTKEE